MKKLLIVFSLLLGLSGFAQDGPYLVRTHEIRVEGNVAAFIDAQKNNLFTNLISYNNYCPKK